MDFDWEYPGVCLPSFTPWTWLERPRRWPSDTLSIAQAPQGDIPVISPGKSDDGENYLQMLLLLRRKLPYGISLSIAAPASYWYLRGFPIPEIASVVDYIVYMTYDLHGSSLGLEEKLGHTANLYIKDSGTMRTSILSRGALRVTACAAMVRDVLALLILCACTVI